MSSSRNFNNRNTLRGGHGGGASSSHGDSRLLENQNDVRMDDLASKVSALRKVTIDIHDEVESQHGLLANTGQSMEGFGSRLRSTTRRFQTVMAQSTTRQSCYIVFGLVFALWLLFYVVRWNRSVPAE
ncbi:hypothetical protein IWQ60_005390 [Tieghemiomyces parasiticus]|uniref:t-SNARE coiled-coil homology domain-containing protein n=1 Tax=Tieghemiomyces parasiticus TaxID=78921 RepID=A0A9W8DT45_9FUNG|nr:hypothetical protein IWQ60_005390 [Tieghemiomyces parasiticus]